MNEAPAAQADDRFLTDPSRERFAEKAMTPVEGSLIVDIDKLMSLPASTPPSTRLIKPSFDDLFGGAPAEADSQVSFEDVFGAPPSSSIPVVRGQSEQSYEQQQAHQDLGFGPRTPPASTAGADVGMESLGLPSSSSAPSDRAISLGLPDEDELPLVSGTEALPVVTGTAERARPPPPPPEEEVSVDIDVDMTAALAKSPAPAASAFASGPSAVPTSVVSGDPHNVRPAAAMAMAPALRARRSSDAHVSKPQTPSQGTTAKPAPNLGLTIVDDEESTELPASPAGPVPKIPDSVPTAPKDDMMRKLEQLMRGVKRRKSKDG